MMQTVRHEERLDPELASPGQWLVTPTHQTMHDGSRHPTFAVLTTGQEATESFVGLRICWMADRRTSTP